MDDALEVEREEEQDIYDIDFCSKDPRNFKNLYLRKRTINNLCKPISSNFFISDPDDT